MMYYFILALILSYNATTHASEQVTATPDSTQIPFVWTDSLIAARGPFATMPPPEVALLDTIDDKLYWQGGVFVLPGTKASVLSENGFLDVKHKPGSVMYDYYEARWPMDMALDSLPLVIRQVRYHRRPFEYPKPWPEAIRSSGSVQPVRKDAVMAIILTIPGLPHDFFKSYGVINPETSEVNAEGWCDEWIVYTWTLPSGPENLPPEFFLAKGAPREKPW